ncbi:MAG: BatA domain-containing protein [Longimicrobiales bacterium]
MMGALNPLFLLAGLAIAVPIFLHLFHRHETRRFSFPALRYLERTEKEHARQIRLRQLLLLLARVAVLLLLVGAGARMIFAGLGGAHPPTAVVIVLDNSMSSGLVLGEQRVLDELKALARESLSGASDEDRFWVIRAGEPWLPAIAGGVAEARAAVDATEASAGRGDLTAALERAVELLRTAELEEREIHLLSDLQRTAFSLPGGEPTGELSVLALAPRGDRPANRALADLLVGGGLPPLEGQRTDVTVSALEAAGDTARWGVRLVLDDRVRGAGTLSAGAQTTIALPATSLGWVQGYVESDPDALRADDRRYFAFRARRAPSVAAVGDAGLFVSEAVAVLGASGRIRPAGSGDADLLIAQDGAGLESRGASTGTLILSPEDPTLLPGLNRRLADAGIPWRVEPRPAAGEAELVGETLPEPLRGTRVQRWYDLAPVGEGATGARMLAEVAGRPWAVDGVDTTGRRYLLLASPLIATATTLPVSAGMVRFLDWAASEWAGAGSFPQYETGAYLPAPVEATHVRFPSGREVEIDGTRTVRGTSEPGVYAFVAADTTVALVALNPPADESRLDPLDRDDAETAIGPEADLVANPEEWSGEIFRTRLGGEAWWPFLLAAALLLIAESLLASTRRGGSRPAERPVAQTRDQAESGAIS